MAKRFLFIFLSVLGVSLCALIFFRADLREFLREWEKTEIPPEISYSPSPSPTVTITSDPQSIPTKTVSPSTTVSLGVNLGVPFLSQAPKGDWSMPFQEACEEASAILVNNFYTGKTFTAEQMTEEILKVVAWQTKNFGYYEHTTSAETARMIREIYGYKRVEVRYDITLEDLKAELQAGRPVIVPLAGRRVGNPYYTAPGPVYHMLVAKGVTKDGDIITNDVGTRSGHNYVFDSKVFFDAIHDVPSGGAGWPAGVDPETYVLSGRKAMIVVYPD